MRDKECEDMELWHAYIKGVKKKPSQPFEDREEELLKMPVPANKKLSKGEKKAKSPSSVSPQNNTLKPSSSSFSKDISTRSVKRLVRRQKLEIEGILDMHGMKQEQAFSALRAFIHRSLKQEKRLLLVITGKGRAENGRMQGVLRAKFADWVWETDLEQAVLSILPALPEHGGEGAFYLRLRKKSKLKV